MMSRSISRKTPTAAFFVAPGFFGEMVRVVPITQNRGVAEALLVRRSLRRKSGIIRRKPGSRRGV